MYTPDSMEGGGIDNLANAKYITKNYFPSTHTLSTNHSAPRRQLDITPSSINSILATAAKKSLSNLGRYCYRHITTEGRFCLDSVATEHMFL